MAQIIKKLLLMFAYGVMLILGAMFTVWASWKAVEFTSGDGKLTAQSGEKLTLSKRNEMVSRVRGIFTDSNGNVGIGTDSPTTSLVISRQNNAPTYWGSAYNSLVYNSDPTLLLIAPIRTIDEGPSIGFKGPSFLYGGIRGSAASSSTTEFGGNLDFFTTSVSSYHSLKMRINQDGNVGIGTNNPQSKLHVNGLINGELNIVTRQSNVTCNTPFNDCQVESFCNDNEQIISGGCYSGSWNSNLNRTLKSGNGRKCKYKNSVSEGQTGITSYSYCLKK